MRANKAISNPKIILACCLLFSFILFILINYCIVSLPKLIGQLKGEVQDFSFFTAFDFSKIGQYSVIYIIAILAIIVINIRMIYLVRISFKDNNVGQKGSARWTELSEIQAQYKEVFETEVRFWGGGGVPVCRYENKLYIDDSPVNNLIIGITRSGKGEIFVFPMIDLYSRAENQASIIVTDPKLELFASSKATLEARGYEVHIINLVEPLKSAGYNPLTLIVEAYKKGEYSTVEMLCNTFATSIFSTDNPGDDSAQFFANASIGVTSALILALIEEKQKQNKLDEVNMFEVVSMLTELASVQMDNGKTALDMYFASRPAGDSAKLKYSTVELAGDRQKGNIMSYVLSKLTIFTYDELSKLTAKSTIDLQKVGFSNNGEHKPQAIFIGIPDYDKSNHYLASVFIGQLQFVLSKGASLSKNGKCEREVVFILDEFGNLPPISSMDNTITVCLGRNIKYNLVVQDYAQLEKLYGKNAETIMGNCGNHIYIQTNSLETAKHFSELIGSETITNVNRSGEKLELNKSITEMYEEKPLLYPTELMELKTGECVIKRVMKRKDLQGNDITPYPIFNHGETRFKYRYEYLLDYFPSVSVSELDIKEIEVKDKTEATDSEIEERITSPKDETKLVSETKMHSAIATFLSENKIASDIEDLTVSECISLVTTAYEEKMLKKEKYTRVIKLLEMG